MNANSSTPNKTKLNYFMSWLYWVQTIRSHFVFQLAAILCFNWQPFCVSIGSHFAFELAVILCLNWQPFCVLIGSYFGFQLAAILRFNWQSNAGSTRDEFLRCLLFKWLRFIMHKYQRLILRIHAFQPCAHFSSIACLSKAFRPILFVQSY